MDSFTTWMLKGLHAKQEKSRLSQISNMIEWPPFRQILEEMYDNKTEKGGRPNCDVILMLKILILQKWYGLSDLEVEKTNGWPDIIYGVSWFSRSLPGFPELYGYSSNALWSPGKDELVWAELQRQLDSMGLQVKRETIQDATFIESDPGSSKKPRGEDAKLDAVEMELGRRKEMRLILAISCTKKPI